MMRENEIETRSKRDERRRAARRRGQREIKAMNDATAGAPWRV